jgi:hypothetical protein
VRPTDCRAAQETSFKWGRTGGAFGEYVARNTEANSGTFRVTLSGPQMAILATSCQFCIYNEWPVTARVGRTKRVTI